MGHKIRYFFEDSSGRQILIFMSKYYVSSTVKSWKVNTQYTKLTWQEDLSPYPKPRETTIQERLFFVMERKGF
jgi:hypothetical protein